MAQNSLYPDFRSAPGRRTFRQVADGHAGTTIVTTSLVGVAALAVCRAILIYQIKTQWGEYYPIWRLAFATLARMGEDAALVTALTLISLGLVATRRPAAAVALHVATLTFVVVMGAINVKIMGLYNAPATLSLMRFAGLSDPRALSTLVEYLNKHDILLVSFACGAVLAAPIGSSIVHRLLAVGQKWTRLLVAGSLVLLVTFISACYGWRSFNPVEDRYGENAAFRFVASFVEPHPFTHLAGTKTGLGDDPFTREPSSELPISAYKVPGHAGVENVAVFVLESVGSQYLDLAAQDLVEIAPGLHALRPISAFFPNAYAHAPSSAISLFNLLSGLYPVGPLGASVTMPEADPELPIPTLISELNAKGYRTGLFFSSGWRYAGYTEFLEYQGVDRVEDYSNRKGCEAQFLASTVPNAATGDEFAASRDQCTSDAMTRWLEQDDSPFFTVLWTDQTHYPYRPDGQADSDNSAAGIAASQARYLRAISVADLVISAFVDWLKSRNLLDDTLVVVVGDHGEGFGQHGVLVHGNEIYDEFVRVPLVLINPELFSGVLRRDVVGLIDVAPTIMEALGQPVPASWQGLSLFGAAIRQKTFFFVPWSDVWMGYRQRMRKINYKVLGGVLEDFDLSIDPGEHSNRAGSLNEGEQQDLVANLWSWQRSLGETYETFRSRRLAGK